MDRPRVLLTGFGPFPGVPRNPSGWLAEALAGHGDALGCALHAQVFPTEWDAVETFASRLHGTLQPHVMIHFGVDTKADGFRIERSAHNRAEIRIDACGAFPAERRIAADGAERLDTRLPVTAIAAHVRGHGITANASRSCGRYLCNFLYYRSLQWAAARGAHALFVHIPLSNAEAGPITQDAMLLAGYETLRFVIAAAAAHPAELGASEEARVPPRALAGEATP